MKNKELVKDGKDETDKELKGIICLYPSLYSLIILSWSIFCFHGRLLVILNTDKSVIFKGYSVTK